MSGPTTVPNQDWLLQRLELMTLQLATKIAGNTHPSTTVTQIRALYLAAVSYQLVKNGITITKRDLYYMCRALFVSPSSIDRTLAALSLKLGIQRNDLNIVAAPKGIVSGPVSYVGEGGEMVNVGMFGSLGCLIPSRPERLTQLSTTAECIIVIEKEAVFESLVSSPESVQYWRSCLMVTGKGYPDHATRNFLSAVAKAQEKKGLCIPIGLLTDADPHGLSITTCYIQALAHPGTIYVGVRPSDRITSLAIPHSSLIPLTSQEEVLMNNMLNSKISGESVSFAALSAIRAELLFLKETKVKFEMEALTCSPGSQAELIAYLMNRFQDELVRLA